jgi:hypothetical protein
VFSPLHARFLAQAVCVCVCVCGTCSGHVRPPRTNSTRPQPQGCDCPSVWIVIAGGPPAGPARRCVHHPTPPIRLWLRRPWVFSTSSARAHRLSSVLSGRLSWCRAAVARVRARTAHACALFVRDLRGLPWVPACDARRKSAPPRAMQPLFYIRQLGSAFCEQRWRASADSPWCL